jgi:hypothetical protein
MYIVVVFVCKFILTSSINFYPADGGLISLLKSDVPSRHDLTSIKMIQLLRECKICFYVECLKCLDQLLLFSYFSVRESRWFCSLTSSSNWRRVHSSICSCASSSLIRYKPTTSIMFPQQRPQNCFLKQLMDGGLSLDLNMTPSKQNPSVPYLCIALKLPVSFWHWMMLLTMQKVEAT